MFQPDRPTEFAKPASPVFATTNWSVVVRAGDSQSTEADQAMERLCRTYWYPLYAFVRRKGYSHEDACDLTQGFFARFLEKRYLKSVDANLGKFRSFLLASVTHFINDEWDKTQALKRGGGERSFSFDDEAARARYGVEPVDHATPEAVFERRWAETVLRVVVERLAAETEPGRFAVLKVFLLEDKGALSYDDASARLGLSVPAVTSAIHRMRSRFGALLVEEVAQTVNEPAEIESEIQRLLAVFSG